MSGHICHSHAPFLSLIHIFLAGESQKLMTSPETKALLDELSARAGELDLVHRREVEELRRSCEQLTRIPADE